MKRPALPPREGERTSPGADRRGADVSRADLSEASVHTGSRSMRPQTIPGRNGRWDRSCGTSSALGSNVSRQVEELPADRKSPLHSLALPLPAGGRSLQQRPAQCWAFGSGTLIIGGAPWSRFPNRRGLRSCPREEESTSPNYWWPVLWLGTFLASLDGRVVVGHQHRWVFTMFLLSSC
jgi:hypothetical protein